MISESATTKRRNVMGRGLLPGPLSRLVLTLGLLVWAPTTAHAAGVNIMAFQPSPFSGDLLSVPGAGIGSGGLFSVGMNFHFTSQPLGIEAKDLQGNTFVEASVESRMMGELLASVAPIEWLDIGLAMPFILTSSGKAAGAGVSTLSDQSGFALGELRLQIRGGLIRDGAVRLAVQLDTTIPTGDDEKLAGNGFGLGPRVMFDVTAGIFTFAMNVGAYFRTETGKITGRGGAPDYLVLDHELLAGLGGKLQVIPELAVIGEMYFRTPLDDPFSDNGTQLEAMGGLRVTPISWMEITVGGGGGTPIIAGYGTSQFRFFGDLRFTPQPSVDQDNDGISGSDDACPFEPEDKDGFEDDDGCPDPDNDRDDVLDGVDRCPLEPEDKDGFEDDDGCPDLDNDGDTVPDERDKCPMEREDADGWQDSDGCPDLDNDGDGIPDAKDKCPDSAEVVNNFQDDDGCPDFPGIGVDGNRIVLAKPLRFKNGRSDVAAADHKVLRNLARLINSNEAWKKVRIEVHLGKKGKSKKIQALTEARGEKLMQLLITEGVGFRRVTFRGMGNSAPLGDLKKRADRKRSTRVEFHIQK